MADKNYVLTFDLSDGSQKSVQFTAPQGPPGPAPVKGGDYWTDDDIAEMEADIAEVLAKRDQLKPEIAQSVEWLAENGDPTKIYVLTDEDDPNYGYLYSYVYKKGSGTTPDFTNVLPAAIDADGNIYNGTGWKDGYRMNSSGVDTAITNTTVKASITGYIEASAGDIFRFKDFTINPVNASMYRIIFFNNTFTFLTNYSYNNFSDEALKPEYDDNGCVIQFTIPKILNGVDLSANLKYIRITAFDEYATSASIITRNEEITYTTNEGGYSWVNMGLAFVPADYEDRIIALEADAIGHEKRIADIEMCIAGTTGSLTNDIGVPDYWLSELETKADTIRAAMEAAGRKKSAFLWYTDAHWVYGNAKVSPKLLRYLCTHTPINKVNFGGDVVVNAQDRAGMKYLYDEWRSEIRDLPNHHSVVGNHDIMVEYPYTFLIAPEESADMVIGNGMYYYIDNPCEKTRYLYLDYLASNQGDEMAEQAEFIVDAIKSVQDGWHIVAISHRWFQYTSTNAPTVGAIPAYTQEILAVFDVYNSRGTYSASANFEDQDFTAAVGKVEFCIGGHIHVDYDFKTSGGIPVIITTSDTNQDRVPDSEVDSGIVGTITESAVFGIIADYNIRKITVVGVGRGTSREISY